jgi:hypothetical protein
VLLLLLLLLLQVTYCLKKLPPLTFKAIVSNTREHLHWAPVHVLLLLLLLLLQVSKCFSSCRA